MGVPYPALSQFSTTITSHGNDGAIEAPFLCMSFICSFPDCGLEASERCSKCKTAHYCSKLHQSQHWIRQHKNECSDIKKVITAPPSTSVSSPSSSAPIFEPSSSTSLRTESSASSGRRECRCMFCGKTELYASEEEAIEHMQTCPALVEQLDDGGQFTLPKSIRECKDD